ncbi:MAG TPA: tRNA (uridine(34)/cytosine(34)/5-carboxymethylaminomethyluridine(34)-2'-O)-methyltransferase TrmL, partial [Chlamydiae bacterium]|nr:tRNA (uridine(34)/cytosine(34)/5-carboxymethylaminomethyluridine(34)-2'-O)-methyltransferase TrmL [Chlamydiota bacterium]
FSLSDRNLKRAGLDYFKDMKLEKIQNLETYLLDKQHFYFFSSKATKTYSSITYEKDAILIFGSETTGLPKIFFEKYEDKFLKIPMKKNSRCLNLSNSVAIALYEALRQNNFSF